MLWAFLYGYEMRVYSVCKKSNLYCLLWKWICYCQCCYYRYHYHIIIIPLSAGPVNIHGTWVMSSLCLQMSQSLTTLIARFMGPTWGPSGADRTQVGPTLTPWTLLSCRLSADTLLTRKINMFSLRFQWMSMIPYQSWDWLISLKLADEISRNLMVPPVFIRCSVLQLQQITQLPIIQVTNVTAGCDQLHVYYHVVDQWGRYETKFAWINHLFNLKIQW